MKVIDRQFIEIMDAIISLAGGLTFIGNEVEANILDQQQLKKIITCLQNNNIIYRYATSDGNGYLNQTNDYINDFFYRMYIIMLAMLYIVLCYNILIYFLHRL